MTREIMLLAAISIAFYALYRSIVIFGKKLVMLENKLLGNKYSGTKGIIERMNEIESLCSPLALLNIFDERNSLIFGDEVDIETVIKNFNKAETERVRLLEEVDRIEKQELQKCERNHSTVNTFTPSDYLKKKILAACAAIVVRQIQFNNLQALKQPFIDAINGKITIQEARKIGKEKVEKLRWIGEPYDIFYNDTRVKKKFEEFYEDCSNRWKNGKWKDRLNFYKEIEKDEI